jgi:hypothetical protein
VDENAENAIRGNNETDSKEIDERDLQKSKKEEPRISTVRGMTMDAREERKNALDRIVQTKRSAPTGILSQSLTVGHPKNRFCWKPSG